MIPPAVREDIINHFSRLNQTHFVPGETPVTLMGVPYGADEVLEALDSMLTTQVTMGEKVRRFESMFAQYIGMKHAVMVNSGSSANLLAMAVLAHHHGFQPGDEVITTPVTWSTTVFPIIQAGALPVFVDVNPNTLLIEPDAIQAAITDRTKAIFPVHLMGNPCAMEQITEIARAHDIPVIEDCCEAHGATRAGKKIGSFGTFSAFSFFFSHHITTIEGGMLLTNDDHLVELARGIRAHGWIRDRSDYEAIARQHPHIDKKWLFATTGYNLRPTELQGAFGLHQMAKLEPALTARSANAQYFNDHLSAHTHLHLPHEQPGTRHAWFGYPIAVRPSAPFTMQELVTFLHQKKIETRPVMSGNMVRQPALAHLAHRSVGPLTHADAIMDRSFMWPVHQGITTAHREYMVATVAEFMKKYP